MFVDDLDVQDSILVNTVHDTRPLVFHGNGVSKLSFNSLTNYLANSWSQKDGCLICKENNIDLSQVFFQLSYKLSNLHHNILALC